MTRRNKVIVACCVIGSVLLFGGVIWSIMNSQSTAETTASPKTENEKIISTLSADAAPATYNLTPRSVATVYKEGEWYLANVVFATNDGGSESYNTILVKDASGEFIIVVSVGDSLLREDLERKSVPLSIVDKITNQSEPDDGQDHYE